MPSVDIDRTDTSMYPSSPPGPPPPGRAVDSPDRRGPSHGPYGYVPGGYGGPPPSAYYPMGPPPPPPSIPEKAGSSFYGQYPPQYNYSQTYPGYGNQPSGPYMTYGYNGAPWMSHEGGGGPPPHGGYYPSQRVLPKDKVSSPSRSSGSGTELSTQQPQYSMRDIDSRKEGRQGNHPIASSSQDIQQQPALSNHKHIHTAEELEQLKASAVVELGLSEVKPIQSNFHFFVNDIKQKLLSMATAEVDDKLEGKSTEFKRKHRSFLIHSNLNCRIMRAWEDLPKPEREEYFKKEEDDRQRFMEEDEVVSRHCFTLTARIRSPSKSKSPPPHGEMEEGDDDEGADDDEGVDDGLGHDIDGPEGGDDEDDDRYQSVNGAENIDHLPVEKRLPDDTTSTTKEESPAKKNKTDGEKPYDGEKIKKK